ncbi:MAG TPA: uroporphyrinogen-III synthase [Novosphingobium sp.]|nr:uroporphyrinogen-III synthase [Novosphingobium sp.]
MSLPLILLRPEPGLAASAAAAHAMAPGVEVVAAPLFAVAGVAWAAPAPAAVDALLLGSANALRHAGPQLAAFAGKPAYAVGAATAEAARAAGLDVVAVGEGGLQALLAHLAPAHRRLLRLAGEERVELTPPPGVALAEQVVYRLAALPLAGPVALLLQARALPGAVVALHSAAAARHFAAECARLGVDRRRIVLATIGRRVATAAGEGWRDILVAHRAEDAALLALALQTCQNPALIQRG